MVPKQQAMITSRMHFSQYQAWFKSALTTSSCTKLRNFHYFTGKTCSSQRDQQFRDSAFKRGDDNLMHIGKYSK